MASRLPALLESVRIETRRREETDRVVSVAWVVAPIVAVVASVVVLLIPFVFPFLAPDLSMALFFGGFLGVFGVLFLVGIIFLYLYYILIKRRNRHFARQVRFFQAAVPLLREAAQSKGIDVEARLVPVERSLREAQDDEAEKSAVLWVVLSFFTGIAALYVFYFLMRDFHRHERREDGLIEDISHVLVDLGQMELPKRVEPVPRRSFALYFILSIITVGIFGIYWIYTLIEDPNTHFREQRKMEAELLSRLEPLAV